MVLTLGPSLGIRRGAVAKRKRRRLHAIVKRQEDSLPSGEWNYNAMPFFQNRPEFGRRDSRSSLKHRVVVCWRFGNFLQHIPVFNDLAVFKTEDIHDRHTAVAGFADHVIMQDHVIAFRDDPF